jgi:UDP-N-acetylglucosamine 1-carboxyvinyltransferase
VIDILCVSGPSKSLNGNVAVSGAKNSSLPLLFSTLLTDEECVLENIPDLEDTNVTQRILNSFGATCEYKNNIFKVKTPTLLSTVAPYGLVKTLRASFWLMGPLLARAGRAAISLPGGDAIGTRPVDLHLKGLSQMGAEFRMDHGVVIGEALGGLSPADITLDFPSVGATHNILMAAALTPGQSFLRGAAKEPEVIDLANFLNLMGANIEGAGTDVISIKGVAKLHGAKHIVIGDRIEAATYMLASAITAGDVTISGIDPAYLTASIDLVTKMGSTVVTETNSLRVIGPKKCKAVSFQTGPYPEVATDVQPIFLAALTICEGLSSVKETVFESRFGHVAEYRRFGADIKIEGRVAKINGVSSLSAAPVEALDIRAAAGLVLMGLVSEGTTQIRELYHLDRGYERIVEKLNALGAKLSRIPAVDAREVVVGC